MQYNAITTNEIKCSSPTKVVPYQSEALQNTWVHMGHLSNFIDKMLSHAGRGQNFLF